MELMDVDEDDLGLNVAPWYRDHEDIHNSERLPEDEQYWEIHVHGRDVSALRDPDVDANYRFDAVIPFEYDDLEAKEFLETEYTLWVDTFEDEFSEAELYSPALPDDM